MKELSRLLDQGIKSIAARKNWDIEFAKEELAFRCARATNRKSLTGGAVHKWIQKGNIPKDEYKEVLAQAAVLEGGMDKQWLKSFLHHARYYGTDNLVEKLFPDSDPSIEDGVSSRRLYHNLPQPNYGRFVGRKGELQKIYEELKPEPDGRFPIITLKGIGGVGKTAISLKVAYNYLHDYHILASNEQFDAIIWFSAKDKYPTSEGIQEDPTPDRTLEDLYTHIACALEKAHILEAPVEKQHALITQALQQQRTLVILDNLETVDDEHLIAFLHRPPYPTKVLITTRHWIGTAYPVEIEGMNAQDATELITRECEKLNISLSDEEIEKLLELTGGVPLAIVLSIGRMMYGRDVPSVLDSLRDPKDDISRFCFEESVNEIRDRPAYQLLMALTMFADPISRDALGYVAGIDDLRLRDHELDKLVKLSLVNRQRDRYKMLPLTREYALYELSHNPDFDERAFNRWVEWAIEATSAHAEYYHSPDIIFNKAKELTLQAKKRVWILNTHPKEPSLQQDIKWIRHGFPNGENRNEQEGTEERQLLNRLSAARRLIQQYDYYEALLTRTKQATRNIEYVRVVQVAGENVEKLKQAGSHYLQHYFEMTQIHAHAKLRDKRIHVYLYRGEPWRNKTFALIDRKYILVQDNAPVDDAYLMNGLRVIYHPESSVLQVFETMFENVQRHSRMVGHSEMQRVYEPSQHLAGALEAPMAELLHEALANGATELIGKAKLLVDDIQGYEDWTIQEMWARIKSQLAEEGLLPATW